MNTAFKASIATLSAGGTAAAGGYAWHSSQLSKLSDLIASDSEVTQLTMESSTEDWKDAWKEYKTKNNLWKLSDYETHKSEDTAPQSFKNLCLSKSHEKVKGTKNDDFQNFKKWCSRNFTISELMQQQGITLLNKQSAEGDWKPAWKKYKDNPLNKQSSSTAAKDVWETSDWTSQNSQDSPSEQFKTKCEEKSKIKVVNRDHETYKQVLDWCTK
ncbi:hypothetical protein MHF_0540 [Mycoplasma haemofelis Ohio2]|uniref:Uncharacterized protein n=1 Tax=Mycoplasma haemofelis (strain Ohio2) TaxID=859194 RepID=F6FHW4_MYCHI|nr:hypothetical protein MHF_0540 [Mycoplasma haemofelis Ohio2]